MNICLWANQHQICRLYVTYKYCILPLVNQYNVEHSGKAICSLQIPYKTHVFETLSLWPAGLTFSTDCRIHHLLSLH